MSAGRLACQSTRWAATSKSASPWTSSLNSSRRFAAAWLRDPWGPWERYRSGMTVTGGLVWPVPARFGGFGAVGRRPTDLDQAAEALPERGRTRSRPDPGPVEPPAPRRSATRVRVCMPCQNAGSNGRSRLGRHGPATRAACGGGSGGMQPRLGRQLGRHAAADRANASAAPPACATILAIMPISIDLTDRFRGNHADRPRHKGS